jgi:glycerol-3-phosphate acyltransferase PlsY
MPRTGDLMLDLPLWGAAFLLAYLLGAVPFGLVLSRLFGLGDIRKIGSGNIGATNVLRTGRKDVAALTLLLDGGKGTLAVLLGARFGIDVALVAALGAFLGHLFPVWLGFKGGKGVATFLGILLGIAWPVGVLACLTWLLTAFLFRYSSLAALVAAVLAPVFSWALASFAAPLLGANTPILKVAELASILAIMVVLKHHQNIRRLLSGEEPRIGAKKG